MDEKTGRYFSYLLRLWQSKNEGQLVWRASLEKPGTSERQGFASIQELVEFLWAQVEEKPHHGTEGSQPADKKADS